MFSRRIDYPNVTELRMDYRLMPGMVKWQENWLRDCNLYTPLVATAYVYMRQHPYGVIGNDDYTLVFDKDLNQPRYEHHVDGFRARLMLLANKSQINLVDPSDFPPDDFQFLSMIFYFHRILLLSVSLPFTEFKDMFPNIQKPDYQKTSVHLDGVSSCISNAIDTMIFMRSLPDRGWG